MEQLQQCTVVPLRNRQPNELHPRNTVAEPLGAGGGDRCGEGVEQWEGLVEKNAEVSVSLYYAHGGDRRWVRHACAGRRSHSIDRSEKHQQGTYQDQ